MRIDCPDIDVSIDLTKLEDAYIAKVKTEAKGKPEVCVCIPVERYGISYPKGYDRGIFLSLHLFKRLDVDRYMPNEYSIAVATQEDVRKRSYLGRMLRLVGIGNVSLRDKVNSERRYSAAIVHDKELPLIIDDDVLPDKKPAGF